MTSGHGEGRRTRPAARSSSEGSESGPAGSRSHTGLGTASKLGVVLGVVWLAGVAAARGDDEAAPRAVSTPARVNVLLITADDMNWDSTGVTGCKIPGITPHIDRLASQGMRFAQGHVTVAVCQPSRSVLMTGRYPIHNGALGFQPIRGDVPTLQERLRAAGYLNGIFAKVGHLAPQNKFCWDVVVSADDLAAGRSPKAYYEQSKAFFAKARDVGRPFFLMANSQDPHRPFAGANAPEGEGPARPGVARRAAAAGTAPISRRYRPDEVTVPAFLPDLPAVRNEIAQFYTSVHRCDEIVGEILRALSETGLDDSTLVMFLSDNGMPFPFAKTNCYQFSTRTPWIVRWPGRVKSGTVNEEDFISGIDFTPTVLEAAGLPPMADVDGRSFLSLLRGEKQAGRDRVFTVFHRTSGGNDFPMRAVHDRRFGYIFNAWADGKTEFRNESRGTASFRAMDKAALDDPAVAARVKMFLLRAREEFYDYQADPAALHNLIDDPGHKEQIAQLRAEMHRTLKSLNDPLLADFEKATQGGLRP
ncbi:MAG: sulfatase [Planctomycetes bacterium]|nr:sulfatase [Planctomycetota bacterium]